MNDDAPTRIIMTSPPCVSLKNDDAPTFIFTRPPYVSVVADGFEDALRILEASVTCNAMPSAGICHVTFELGVTQTTSHLLCNKATLRFALASGSKVCRFAQQIEATLVDAVVLPVAKAAKVEYKEREAGRTVSVAQKLVGDNFEVVISKIPRNAVKRVLVEYVAPLDLESTTWKHSLPFAIDPTHLTAPIRLHTLIFGNTLGPDAANNSGGSIAFSGLCDSEGLAVCVAAGTERDSFLIRIPAATALKSLTQSVATEPSSVRSDEPLSNPKGSRRAIFWDTSRSAKAHASAFLSVVADLLDQPNTLWTCVAFDFSARVVAKDAEALSGNVLVALSKERYDGGTRFNCLNEVADQIEGCDEAYLFSDGMDSLGTQDMFPLTNAGVPIHVFKVPKGNATFLHTLARTTGGSVLSLASNAAKTEASSQPQILLESVLPSSSSTTSLDCFMEDGLQTVPDFRLSGADRLGTLCETANAITLYGVAPSKQVPTIWTFEFVANGRKGQVVVRTDAWPTMFLSGNSARAVEVAVAAARMLDAATIFSSPALVASNVAEIALAAKIPSDHTTLTFLETAEQFSENGIPCPSSHPAHANWLSLARTQKSKEEEEARREKDNLEKQLAQATKLLKDASEAHLHPKESPKHQMRSLLLDGACGKAETMESAPSSNSFVRSVRARPNGVDPSEFTTFASMANTSELCLDEMCDEEVEDGSCDDMECGLFDSGDRPSGVDTRDWTTFMALANGSEIQVNDLPVSSRSDIRRDERASSRASGTTNQNQSFIEVLDKSPSAADAASLYQKEESDSRTPAFFLEAARILYSKFQLSAAECARVATNVLELCGSNKVAQVLRATGYFLLHVGLLDAAIETFEQVAAVAPEEPQSFIDLGLARFFRVRSQKGGHVDAHSTAELGRAVKEVATVLTRTWNARFPEIHYPALLWTRWMLKYATDQQHLTVVQALALLPTPELAENKSLWEEGCSDLGLVVSFGWDVDRVDLDLHVDEPDGSHVYYGNRTSATGGSISRDYTDGYGPEVYVHPNPPAGKYEIRTNYFAQHSQSSATGSSSGIVWAVTDFGRFDKEKIVFRAVRLQDVSPSNKGSSILIVQVV